MKIFLGQFYAVMILHKDLVQFGGPGTELAQRCPRNCPWIVLATKITEKEGIVPKVIVGRISIISILSPVASLQIGGFGFLFMACHTITLQYGLDQAGETERIRAIDVRLDP